MVTVMDRREAERLLAAIRQVRAQGQRAAMATVVRVRGSAYRREGTPMLVRQDGTYECVLSGGCLEPSVAAAAAEVIATGQPTIATYDLADDSPWGLSIGCSGAVDIRIERLEDDAITSAWLNILDSGEAAVRLTPLSGSPGRMIVYASGATAGSLGDPALERQARAQALERLLEPFPSSGPTPIGETEMLVEIALPPPELVIFGAGHDAVPLAHLAWTLGFVVTVVDPRDALLTADRFPHATLVSAHVDRPVTAPRTRFMVVMNHHVGRDEISLRDALESDAAWIGVLGPRSRYEKLSAHLAAEGFVAAGVDRVRSPVGLSLGAETPEEVAVSIVGEILAFRRGFEGGFLNGSAASLHRPAEARTVVNGTV
jgi:xanthine dehydrogenase accessory factor